VEANLSLVSLAGQGLWPARGMLSGPDPGRQPGPDPWSEKLDYSKGLQFSTIATWWNPAEGHHPGHDGG